MKRLVGVILCCLWVLCAFAAQKSETVVYINGSKYYVHTVQPGQTLYVLAREYGVGESVIVQHNPAAAAGLKIGENLKIPFTAQVTETKSEKKLRKSFDMHFVSKGETLYGISRLYGIDIPTLIADNQGLDPLHLRLGERILVRRKEIGNASEQEAKTQWEKYRNSLNSVSETGRAYHIVQPGETFYSLSRQLGISEAELSALNNGLKPADLKAGAMIQIPGNGKASASPIPDGGELSTEELSAPASEQEPLVFHPLKPEDTLRIALLLPLSTGGSANNNFMEFYQGFLLGLDSVRNRYGYNIDLTLFNTDRDVESVRRITETPEFRRSNLIVGPVYEEVLQPVIDFAEEHAVPVISPLANIRSVNSDALFQLAPDPAAKYEKISDLTDGSRRITLIYASGSDKEFEQEVLAQLGNTPYNRHTYKYQHPSMHRGEGGPSDLSSLLQGDGEKLFVVMADNEVDVERILAALASAYTNLTSRGSRIAEFTVLGNARWNRYNNIDRTIFFKDHVVFLSTYHAKRDSDAVVNFDSNYIRAFGALPTLYSYRGYDAAVIFATGSYSDIQYNLEGRSYTPLQTTYIFEQSAGRRSHVNRNWMRVNYNHDFTISLE